jgi:putative Ca2+/H+ antiporter (TMEM165/GDT1 family)
MDWLVALLTAFALVVPVELPDKTFVATLVLATRHRPLPVWLGVIAAFAVQCAIAAGAGQLLGLLPERPVRLVAAALFAVGAVVLFRQARRGADDPEAEYADAAAQPRRHGLRAAATSFLVLFAAEWGDLSQLLTAGLVAGGRPALAVALGAWLGLAVVAGAAVLLGRALLKRIRLSVVRYVGAGCCAVLAAFTVVAAI